MKISIIIPVKNGIATIRQCLDAIFAQTLIDQTEVIVIDSGSTDGTLEVLQEYPIRLYQIPPENFNHGTTRNYGVSLTKGEFIVMTVQDAVATDNKWLEKITLPFYNPQIMGVCGRQMVPEEIDKNPGAWTKTFSEPQTIKVCFSVEEIIKLTPLEKRNKMGWDNVTSAYRKTALLAHPFPKTNYSEDISWALEMYQKGYCLAYASMATVFHYHHETFKYRYKRSFIETAQHFFLYQYKANPFITKNHLIPFYRIAKTTVNHKPYWFWYNLRILTANWLATVKFRLILAFNGKIGLAKYYNALTQEIPIGNQYAQ